MKYFDQNLHISLSLRAFLKNNYGRVVFGSDQLLWDAAEEYLSKVHLTIYTPDLTPKRQLEPGLEPVCVGGLLQDPETKMGWLP